MEAHDYDCVLVRDVPIKKSDRTGRMSYLVDNVHEVEGKKYIHGWAGEFLPVLSLFLIGTSLTNTQS